jgi:hypothetical protein
MMVFSIRIEHPLDMTVQRLHNPDPRHHRRDHCRATSIRTSIVVCHSGNSNSFFGRLVMSSAASRCVSSVRPSGSRKNMA